ncbi:MAG: G1 family glutamic endopeptidase [Candidatus Bathyarchaeia archaeon]
MKIAIKLSMFFVSSLMLLAAFSPALALAGPITSPTMSLVDSINGTVYSTNWSGYAVTGAAGSVTSAGGSWIVPTVTGSNGQYASFWVGIDGYGSSTLEQTGILAQVTGNRRTSHTIYYAWYEFYPLESIIEITTATKIGTTTSTPATVNAQDTISAIVTQVSGTT